MANNTSTTTKDNCATDDHIEYTDVIIIGNGPSGISLSYFLSGHWPYYSGSPHPDEYLQMRLQSEGLQTSIIEQDLEYLASGLEGRSSNPVALLFDALSHPEADMGCERPSLLTWKEQPEKVIPHVVLGKMEPGGAWQMMEGQMQTLSLGTWMQLPGLPFREWLSDYRKENRDRKVQTNRASMEDVRQYYLDYVTVKGLSPYFKSHHMVTSVQRVLDVCHRIDHESGEQLPCNRDHSGKLKWEVRGFHHLGANNGGGDVSEFCFRAPHVVVATGTFDLPNRLRVPGEHYPYVLHSFAEIEALIERGDLDAHSADPLVVIGAGLSAADAILCALEKGIPVIHVFRRDVEDPNIAFKKLPPALYPEYHNIQRLMAGKEEMDGYHAYPCHVVSEFLEDKQILIRSKEATCDTIVKTEYVLVSVGSRPDLAFLPKEGKHLGVIPGAAIDSKHNPIDVDALSHQSVHESGLFALGPLVGDNFVRFLQGGSLAIASHLTKKKEGKL